MTLHPWHRARRFFTSLFPSPPSASEVAWAHDRLQPREVVLFDRMAAVDQVHSIGVAKAVERHLGSLPECVDFGDDTGWMVVAALTHDVGKSEAGLGIVGRVVATLLAAVGAQRLAQRRLESGRAMGPLGRYLVYPQLGAEMLRSAGASAPVVAWAAEHHEPESAWSVPVAVGRVLVAADDGALRTL